MTRPIKFRGRDAYGKLHYGDLWQRTDGTILFDHDEHVWQRIHPDSVAQFVGYDKNGNEVYEGDTVIEEYVEGKRQEYIARLEPITQVPETAQFDFFPFPAPFTTLKETKQ